MIVKGKDGVETEMVYKRKACAVGKTQPFIFSFFEGSFCNDFNIFVDSKNIYTAFACLVHKLDGSGVAASHFKKRVGFVQDIIRCINDGLSFLKFNMNSLSLCIILVIRNGKGAEGACVYKDLQLVTAPYRYLS